jgi:hypothetical protein
LFYWLGAASVGLANTMPSMTAKPCLQGSGHHQVLALVPACAELFSGEHSITVGVTQLNHRLGPLSAGVARDHEFRATDHPIMVAIQRLKPRTAPLSQRHRRLSVHVAVSNHQRPHNSDQSQPNTSLAHGYMSAYPVVILNNTVCHSVMINLRTVNQPACHPEWHYTTQRG